MSSPIIIGAVTAVTISDVLNGTRLQTAPSGGIMTFQMQADLSGATNFFTTSLQLPDGSTPLDKVQIPAGSLAAEVGQLDERLMMQVSFAIQQGGHVVWTFTENGAGATAAYRVVFTPAR